MKRFAAALSLAAALLALAPPPALAADRAVKLTLDGRPVDRAGGIAVARNGVVFADVIDLVKSFDGLLTFQGNAVVVSIHGSTGRFTAGSRTALIDGASVTMEGAVFMRNGDLFVPLNTFITRIAKAQVHVSPDRSHADIAVNASP